MEEWEYVLIEVNDKEKIYTVRESSFIADSESLQIARRNYNQLMSDALEDGYIIRKLIRIRMNDTVTSCGVIDMDEDMIREEKTDYDSSEIVSPSNRKRIFTLVRSPRFNDYLDGLQSTRNRYQAIIGEQSESHLRRHGR